jgi:fumarate hydratase subunit beta
MAVYDLQIPISKASIRELHVGDQVRLFGVMVTARDAAHKYMKDTFFQEGEMLAGDRSIHDRLADIWRGGVMYHCGPVVSRGQDGRWRFVSAGPTTSIREEPYEADVIQRFGLRAVIGKGGMGPRTLAACQRYGAVYLHAVGGAATLLASYVKEVVDVFKKDELGVPEAFWVVRVEGFPAVVTMDSHGVSLHQTLFEESRERLNTLL